MFLAAEVDNCSCDVNALTYEFFPIRLSLQKNKNNC